MRSGKDSLALIFQNKLKPYYQTIFKIKFAEPLKLMVLSGLNLISSKSSSDPDALHKLDEQLKDTETPLNKIASIQNLISFINHELEKYNFSGLSKEEKQAIYEASSQSTKEAYRFLLQFIGTDVFRKRRKDFWTEQTIDRIKILLTRNQNSIAIVSDLRFPDEADALRKNFCSLIIKTVRTSNDYSDYNSIQRHSKSTCSDHISETSVDLIRPDVVIVASDLQKLEIEAEKLIEKLEEQKRIPQFYLFSGNTDSASSFFIIT